MMMYLVALEVLALIKLFQPSEISFMGRGKGKGKKENMRNIVFGNL
jgi:hypothetical protein